MQKTHLINFNIWTLTNNKNTPRKSGIEEIFLSPLKAIYGKGTNRQTENKSCQKKCSETLNIFLWRFKISQEILITSNSIKRNTVIRQSSLVQ